MALDKKQLLMLIGAVAAGIVAAVLSAQVVSIRINDETSKLANQYKKDQQQEKKKYDQQIMAMNQKIAEVESRAKTAAEEAAKATQEKAKKVAQEAEKKPQVSLAVKTPPGKRAITVMIEPLEAVGGMLNPGDFVDVIAHLDVPDPGSTAKDQKKSHVTAIIFQKLQILAVNTNIETPGVYEVQQKERGLRITFAVDPQEAGLLAFADKNGKLELALRGLNEKSRQMVSAATWSTLAEYVLENQGADIQPDVIKEEPPPVLPKVELIPEKTEEVRPYIQIYRGGKEL
jgi:pilus assembly protein CpaB